MVHTIHKKYSAKINSGQKLGKNLSAFARLSSISSDGYRDYHDSDQKAFSAGIEHRTPKNDKSVPGISWI